ncbi:hypothetical protein ASZ90_020186 [hydrocarbon metagenome]|uniref:Uncharacterized protein n=1 Tax=hydrocarbon metagenome TaxID=938273 RepID=A0A0W8E1F3_9ZZZZ
MRNLSQDEMLALTTLLRAETNGLAVSKAVYGAIGDNDLKRMTEAGIASSESRIRTLQQFLTENNFVTGGVQ